MEPLASKLLQPDALTTVYQPIVERKGDALATYALEALSRGPVGSNLEDAGVLFEYVRRRRLEAEIDRVCLRNAVAGFAKLEGADSKLRLHVNLHAITLHRDASFADFLVEVTESHGVPPDQLTLELLEHGYFWEARSFATGLESLIEKGPRIALDDVGSGVANFRMIHLCPAQYYKVDRFLVDGLRRDARRRAVVSALVGLAGDLGARVVVEGVERAADLETAFELGVELVQGYLLSAPRAMAELSQLGCDGALSGRQLPSGSTEWRRA